MMLLKNKISLSSASLFVGITILSLFLADMVYNFISIPAFRHDELKYIPSYYGKLRAEGRWLNYLFFNSLQYVNIKFASSIGIGCFFIFAYRCMENVLEKKYAILIALLCLFIPPIHLLNEWAQTAVLSLVLLAMASLSYKSVHKLLFFLIFGILFNGVLSHFYFLLPLLFIGDKKLDKYIIFYWIVGFVVGFIITQIITLILCRSFIRLDSWRNPNYIYGLEDAIINLKKASRNIISTYNFFGKTALCFLPICGLLISYEIFKKNLSLIHIVVLVMVSLSIFALAIPAGLNTDLRSTTCLFMATIMVFVLALRKIRIALILFAIFLSSYFYMHNMQNITFIKTVMSSWMSDLSSIPVVPESIRGLVVLSEDKDFNRLSGNIQQNTHVRSRSTEGLGEAMRWRPVACELGYGNVMYGNEAKNFVKKQGMTEKLKSASYKETSYYRYTVIDNYLFLSVK
ncbi:hypothetical protein [Desulfovibrio sp. ZJ369]|uniref:hypothetical protein n=1 Tax=Desulfovibrio sp. ZJ369 TaxID=2709793 RepID=UPI00198029D5|nr:hypothetical protein [Desulfovibrio sp. ZJ369]